MKNVSACFLYGIVDLGYVPPQRVEEVTRALLEGGVDILQLRGKSTSKEEIREVAALILSVTGPAGIPLIINDYPDLLREVEAQGCHLGQTDGSIEEARRLAGRPCLVGRSTHSVDQALAAQQEGADYIGFGPLFATATKPDAEPIGLKLVAQVFESVQIPVFGIGGVKLDNLPTVRAAGANRVCIVSDLLLAPNITKQARAAKAALS